MYIEESSLESVCWRSFILEKGVLENVQWRMYKGECILKIVFWRVGAGEVLYGRMYTDEVYTEEGIMENV